jgi:hypothetical protein
MFRSRDLSDLFQSSLEDFSVLGAVAELERSLIVEKSESRPAQLLVQKASD